ncbi:MAG: hypothetical protein HY736_03425 [Verrucomicrobia bacterium]|nr:hypothetical protein [Verrucomicrobiota bacterium]
MNVTTSVAFAVYGDVADGNVGEFLKFLPGVDLEYVDAETRGPRLGGLDPQYAGVTLDGSKLASADAFASYNGMINGGTGDAVRSVGPRCSAPTMERRTPGRLRSRRRRTTPTATPAAPRSSAA